MCVCVLCIYIYTIRKLRDDHDQDTKTRQRRCVMNRHTCMHAFPHTTCMSSWHEFFSAVFMMFLLYVYIYTHTCAHIHNEHALLCFKHTHTYAQAQVLRSRLSSEETNMHTRRHLETEVKELRTREQDLVAQIKDLRRALEDQEEKETQQSREAEYLGDLRSKVEQSVPDLEDIERRVAERNNADREERDRKVLRILKAKDQRIGELQGENAGLLRAIDQQRMQTDALQAALNEAQRQMDDLIGAREDAVRQLHVDVAIERDKCIHVRQQLEDAQRELLACVTAKRQLSDALRDKSRLEAEVDDMLRDRTELQGRIAQLEQVVAEATGKDARIADLHKQLREQGEQLDALVAELSSYAGGTVVKPELGELEDLTERVRQLEAENSRLRASSEDAHRVFTGQVDKLRRSGDPGSDAQAKIARLEAALALAERGMTRAAAETIQNKDAEIANLKLKIRELQLGEKSHGGKLLLHAEKQSHSGVAGGVRASTGSLNVSFVHGQGVAALLPAESGNDGARVMDELKAALEREQKLEHAMRESKLIEQKLRTQVAKLERIQSSAQSTALEQEEKLHKAVTVITKSSEALDHTTDKLSREAHTWKQRAEQLQTQVYEYDAALVELEKDLDQCKRILRIYHDRIVQIVGPDDDVVHTTRHWENKVPLSVHLRTTGKLGKQHASDRRRLEQTIETQARALEEAREELMHTQAAKITAEHECERKLADHDATIRELQHQIRCRKDDGTTRLQELEQTVKMLSSKSDTHKKIAMLGAEISALKVSEQRLSHDARYFEEKAQRAEQELRECTERVALLQVKMRSMPSQPVPGRSELLASSMTEQIEQQQSEIERLEILLRVAKEEHDRRELDASRRDEEMHSTRMVAESHERMVTELHGDILRLEKELRDAHDAVRAHASTARRYAGPYPHIYVRVRAWFLSGKELVDAYDAVCAHASTARRYVSPYSHVVVNIRTYMYLYMLGLCLEKSFGMLMMLCMRMLQRLAGMLVHIRAYMYVYMLGLCLERSFGVLMMLCVHML
jgi:chromosome segregation ATPase